ncbi:MAG: Fic family protein [Clostridiales bacterium]|nr:Fic family protein [Clostridiales bacterium]
MYTDLLKVFYSDKDNYERVFETRYQDPYAIHLDFLIGTNQAFFLPLPELLISIGNIRRIDKSIYILTNALPGEAMKQFVRRCLVDEIELTNGIEGVHSSRREIRDLLIDMEKKNTHKRFWGIVNKYYLLMNKEQLPLETCEDIRAIYNELVYAEIYKDDPDSIPDGMLFRKAGATVTTATQRSIHRGLFPEQTIILAMEKALHILHDESLDVFFRISAFHYFFGYIHPFYDGNGRTSRFISSYLLSQVLEPIIGYRLSYTIRENLQEYYAAFNTCNNPANRGDITPFLIMLIGIIEKSMVLLEKALIRRKGEYAKYCEVIPSLHKGMEGQAAELYNLLIQAGLFSDEGISLRNLMDTLSISRQTLRKRLRELDQELLIEHRIASEKHYQIDISKLNQLLLVQQRAKNNQLSLF